MINLIIQQEVKPAGTYTLCITIEEVYFIYLDKKMLLNTLIQQEAEEFYDICVKGYKFFNSFENE